jgi:predicted aspartyl protease
MRINGIWIPCDDGVIRPIIAGRVASGNEQWIKTEFLIDTGADRTVLSASILEQLVLPRLEATEEIGGLGGVTDSVVIETRIQLLSEAGAWVSFRSRFVAVTDLTALDFSVMGRDILDLFALIVDRPRNVVCLLNQQHRYIITQS